MSFAIIHSAKEEVLQVSSDLITGIQAQVKGSQGQRLQLTDVKQSNDVCESLERNRFQFLVILLDSRMISILGHRRSSRLFYKISEFIQASPREQSCVLFVKHQVSDDEVSEFREEFKEGDISLHMIEFTTNDEVSRYTSKCMIDREATESEERSTSLELSPLSPDVLPDNRTSLSSESNLNINSLIDSGNDDTKTRIPKPVLELESIKVDDAARQIGDLNITAENNITPTATSENAQQIPMQNNSVRGQVVDPSIQPMAIHVPAVGISANQLVNFQFPANQNGTRMSLPGNVTSVNQNSVTATNGDLDNGKRNEQPVMGVAGVGNLQNKETNTAQSNADIVAINPIAYLSENYTTTSVNDGKNIAFAGPKSDITGESIVSSYVRFHPGGGVPGFCIGCREMTDCLPLVGLLPSFNSEFTSLPTFNTFSSKSGPQAMPCLSGYGYCSKCNEAFSSNLWGSQQISVINSASTSTQIADILTTDVRPGMMDSVVNFMKGKENDSTSQSLNMPHPLSTNNIQNLHQYNDLHKSTSMPAFNSDAAYRQQTEKQQWQQPLNLPQPLPTPPQQQHQQLQFLQMRGFNSYGQPVGFEINPVPPTQNPVQPDLHVSLPPQNIPVNDEQLNNMNKVHAQVLYTREMEFNISGGSCPNSGDSETDNTKASLSTKQTQTEQQPREEMTCGYEPSGGASYIPSTSDSNGASYSSSDSASAGATGCEHQTLSDDREVWDLSKKVFTYIQEALDLDTVHNWKDIADIHNWSYGEIHRVQQKWRRGQIESPFLLLLDYFKGYTVRNLKDDLRKISRKDVLVKLERFENNNELFSGRF